MAVKFSAPANADAKQPKGQWKKGQSGNPAGKKPGTKNRATLMAEKLLDGEVEDITRQCIDRAKAGDPVAMRLCLERLLPPRKGRPIAFSLPDVKSPSDLPDALTAVLKAVSTGELTPEEGQALQMMLENVRKAYETVELAKRLDELEARLKL